MQERLASETPPRDGRTMASRKGRDEFDYHIVSLGVKVLRSLPHLAFEAVEEEVLWEDLAAKFAHGRSASSISFPIPRHPSVDAQNRVVSLAQIGVSQENAVACKGLALMFVLSRDSF